MNVRDTLIGVEGRCGAITSGAQEGGRMQGLWVEYEDWGGVGVNVGSSQAYCGEGRGERVVCARGTV